MHPPGKVSYYRLKQVDYDGQFTYSSVIAIHKKSDLYPISCFPNPASDVLNILFNNSGNNNVSIIIYDISGREIIREEKVVSEGSNILTLETNALSSGSYSVSLLNSRNEILARDLFLKK